VEDASGRICHDEPEQEVDDIPRPRRLSDMVGTTDSSSRSAASRAIVAGK
jgi:hypothetical protein